VRQVPGPSSESLQRKNPREEVAALPRALWGLSRGGRVSLREVSAELAERGYKTPSGKPYSASAVQSMLG
jgi:hypothetical protein